MNEKGMRYESVSHGACENEKEGKNELSWNVILFDEIYQERAIVT